MDSIPAGAKTFFPTKFPSCTYDLFHFNTNLNKKCSQRHWFVLGFTFISVRFNEYLYPLKDFQTTPPGIESCDPL